MTEKGGNNSKRLTYRNGWTIDDKKDGNVFWVDFFDLSYTFELRLMDLYVVLQVSNCKTDMGCKSLKVLLKMSKDYKFVGTHTNKSICNDNGKIID